MSKPEIFILETTEMICKHPLYKTGRLFAIVFGAIGIFAVLTETNGTYFGIWALVLIIMLFIPAIIHDKLAIKWNQELEEFREKIRREAEKEKFVHDYIKQAAKKININHTKYGFAFKLLHKESGLWSEMSPKFFYKRLIEQKAFSCPFDIINIPFNIEQLGASENHLKGEWWIVLAYIVRKAREYNYDLPLPFIDEKKREEFLYTEEEIVKRENEIDMDK